MGSGGGGAGYRSLSAPEAAGGGEGGSGRRGNEMGNVLAWKFELGTNHQRRLLLLGSVN